MPAKKSNIQPIIDPEGASVALWKALKSKDEEAIITTLFQQPSEADQADEDEVFSRIGAPHSFAVAAVAITHKDGTPPLLFAAQNRAGDVIVTLLLAAGADANGASERGEKQVPLIAACWGEDDQVMGALLTYRKRAAGFMRRHNLSKNMGLLNLTATDAVGRNCFHVCCMMGCHMLLSSLVDHCVATAPTKNSAVNVLSAAFSAQDTSDLSTPLHKALEQVGNGDRRYSQCAADVLGEVLGITVSESGTSPVELSSQVSDVRVNGDARRKILTAVDRAGDSLLHTLAFAVVGVHQCAVFYRRLAYGVLAGCCTVEAAKDLLSTQNEEGNTAVHCLCESGADFRGTIEPVLQSAVNNGIVEGVAVWELMALDTDGNGATPLSAAAAADGAASFGNDQSEPNAFLGVLDVLKTCTGESTETRELCRGFDLKGNPYHKAGIGRALLIIGLQVAAKTRDEDIEASLSSKQLMEIKENVIHKYVGGVLHQVLLGTYKSLFRASGLAPSIVRELEIEVVTGAAKLAAAPLLQARSQRSCPCDATECADEGSAEGDGGGDGKGGDFSGVGSSGERTGGKVEKAKEGPSMAAQILCALLLIGMLLPLLERILPKLGL